MRIRHPQGPPAAGAAAIAFIDAQPGQQGCRINGMIMQTKAPPDTVSAALNTV